ncbi:type VI secretion system accessory protein TagJ [Bordetella sp. 2513F-2]
MPQPTVSLRDGTLTEHLEAVAARVRSAPADADLRAQLFQLRAVQGDWKRASEQLRLCAELNPAAQPMAALYGQAMLAEAQREAVLGGNGEPAFPAGRPAWCDLLLQALAADADDSGRAASLRAEALEAAPTRAGTLRLAVQPETSAYAWICDGDSRLGPVFELITGGRYGWLPFDALRRVSLLEPEGLSDVVWARAEVELASGPTLHGLVPARYPAPPGQALSGQDERFCLGRVTEWRPLADDTYAGQGQKMWMTDAGEFALLDIRSLEQEEG